MPRTEVVVVVEVVQLLSNPCHPAAKLLAAWDGTTASEYRPPLTTEAAYQPGQVQHRLSPEVVAELVEAYKQGGGIDELASQFQVHRTTVMAHLDRSHIERRRRGLAPEQVDEAGKLYSGGWSLARVGEHFSVDGETVRAAFRKLGFETRPRRGWKAGNSASP